MPIHQHRTAERDCNRCGAPIMFVRDVETRKALILNARPIEGGTVVLLGAGEGQVVPGGRGLLHSLHACGGGGR